MNQNQFPFWLGCSAASHAMSGQGQGQCFLCLSNTDWFYIPNHWQQLSFQGLGRSAISLTSIASTSVAGSSNFLGFGFFASAIGSASAISISSGT